MREKMDDGVKREYNKLLMVRQKQYVFGYSL